MFVREFDGFLANCSRWHIRAGWLNKHKGVEPEFRQGAAIASVSGYMTAPASQRLFDEVREKAGAAGTLEALVIRYADLFPQRSVDAARAKLDDRR